MQRRGRVVAGYYDDFPVAVDCPACSAELSAPYGRLRIDPRLTCRCGTGFIVCLAGSPIEVADQAAEAGARAVNDNRKGRWQGRHGV